MNIKVAAFTVSEKSSYKRIVSRPMCDSQIKKACLDDGNAVRQLRQWLSSYHDVFQVDESKSGNMIHFYRRAIGQQQMKDKYTQYKDNFCVTHLLFHKATSEYTWLNLIKTMYFMEIIQQNCDCLMKK